MTERISEARFAIPVIERVLASADMAEGTAVAVGLGEKLAGIGIFADLGLRLGR